jgi:hypothetical protein
MSTQQSLPSKTITFKVLENSYTVPYPNNGQLLDIESTKSLLTRQQYHSIAQGEQVSAQRARLTTDWIAFMSVCCPDLKKELLVNSFSELDQIASKKILLIYIRVILPWLIQWEDILNADDEEQPVEKV